MTLENGLQIWEALVRSGLEETRKNHLPGYDSEVVAVLKEQLYPHATRSLDQELRAAPPSPEIFLDVFFRALKPFSEMLHDVLGMFEAAGARRSEENLRIVFDFSKASKPLALTLQEFREVEAFSRRVARSVVERVWNSDTLFSLIEDVRQALESIGVPDAARNLPAVVDPRVRRWIEENGRPAWLPFPGFPTSLVRSLDESLRMAEGLIRVMYTEVRKLGASYDEFARRLSELPWEDRVERDGAEGGVEGVQDERPRRTFVSAAHDFWPNSFAKHVCLGVEAVNDLKDDNKPEVAAVLVAAIRRGFDRPPRRERTILSLEQDFRDLVNLPIWKKRHELYAVWVASRMADALKDLSWDWHPDGDTLRFSFAGTELATLRSSDGDTHIFWTEKRTKLKETGVFGRKQIQPDYRIMTVPTHRDEATTLVVECKQYRNWKKKNFGAALDDYAKGCPNAPVVLVNYGPTDSRILDLVDVSRRDRTFLVGDFKPCGDAGLARFRDLVRAAYTTLYAAKAWGQPLRDAHWARLPVTARLLSELRRWNRLGGEPFHRIYWYAARCREWAVTPRRLPGLKVLASLPCDDTRNACIASLLPIASGILVREIEDFPNAMVMVGMPPDFAVFDEEPSLQILQLPPLLRQLAGNLEITASLTERPQGPAVVCMGWHPVPPNNVATWIAGGGREITEETGFVLWYPCYPGGRVEAAFLTHNIAYWRFFDALPALFGPYRWSGKATDSLEVDYNHPSPNSKEDYCGEYARSAALRDLFAQSVSVAHSDPRKTRTLLDEWAEATKMRFRTGRRSKVHLQTWTRCPTISGVGVPPKAMVTEVEKFLRNCPTETTKAPFLTFAIMRAQVKTQKQS